MRVAVDPAPASLGANRDFKLFWAGQTLSALGDAFAMIAIPLLVLRATGSVAKMGLVTGAFGAGAVLGALATRQLHARWDRRRLMIAADLGRVGAYSLLPLGFYLGRFDLTLVCTTALLSGCLSMLYSVLYSVTVKALVLPSQLTAANGRLQLTNALAYALGPVLAGALCGTAGPAVVIGVDVLTYALAACSLVLLRLPSRPAPARALEPRALATLLRGDGVLRSVLLVFALQAVLTTGATDLFIFMLKRELHASDRSVGLTYGLACVGAVVGSFAAPALRRRLGFAGPWLAALLVQSCVLASLSEVRSLGAMVPLTMAYALGESTRGVLSVSLCQERAPAALFERVMALFSLAPMVLGPLGAVALTALAQRAGVGVAFAVLGAGCMAVFVGALASPVRSLGLSRG